MRQNNRSIIPYIYVEFHFYYNFTIILNIFPSIDLSYFLEYSFSVQSTISVSFIILFLMRKVLSYSTPGSILFLISNHVDSFFFIWPHLAPRDILLCVASFKFTKPEWIINNKFVLVGFIVKIWVICTYKVVDIITCFWWFCIIFKNDYFRKFRADPGLRTFVFIYMLG